MKSLWARLGAAIVVGTFAAVTAQAQPVEREGVKLEPAAQVGMAIRSTAENSSASWAAPMRRTFWAWA